MTTLTITRGLPGCGKTTYARAWVAEDPANRFRVNRDDLRAMSRDSVFIKGATEAATIAARDALIGSLLAARVDVICDDTNLPNRTVRDLRRVADANGAEFEVIDMTDVDPNVCVERDAQRGDRTQIGYKIITDLYYRFIKGKPHPLPVPDPEPRATAERYTPVPGRPSAVLVDIDGTTALMGDRNPYDETRVSDDTPNEPVCRLVRELYELGEHIVFCSGRSTACRQDTEVWIDKHLNIPDPVIFMRAQGDTRRDAIVKLELFDEHIRDQYDVRFVLDDRNQVVEAWRSIGLTVLQVADGAF